MIKVKLTVNLKEGNHLFTEEKLELIALPRIGEKIVAREERCKVLDVIHYKDHVYIIAEKLGI